MRILALDPATVTGWASWHVDDGVESGREDFSVHKEGHVGRLWIAIDEWLHEMIRRHRPDIVVQETPIVQGSARIPFGFMTLCQRACAMRDVEWCSVHPSTLKKWATGSGRAKKEDMIREARRRWPRAGVWNDNEADARLMAEWAAANPTEED